MKRREEEVLISIEQEFNGVTFLKCKATSGNYALFTRNTNENFWELVSITDLSYLDKFKANLAYYGITPMCNL